MKRCKELVITKRDGTVERFSLPKLVSGLRVVLEGRSYDGRLAGPLAKAVEMHLHECRGSTPPRTDYIFRCVVSVLQQTGLSDVAEDLQLHRRLRAARRRRTRVFPAAGAATARGVPWQKTDIVAALENHYGLRHSVARFLAGQIESQVFGLNYRLITRPFLAELVRSEVLAWGLASEDVLQKGAADCVAPAAPTRDNPRSKEHE
ncbi:MAG: hypothetical protein IPM13_05275 [Phycisphaerales bacterium]|nr:hypothetical protein [Phycisphaerales bacterium]